MEFLILVSVYNKTKSLLNFRHQIYQEFTVLHRCCSDRELTLKAPNKNCSRRHYNFLLLSFEENKA